jgi:uncharacterized membrane protein YhiD involved in acid resistance
MTVWRCCVILLVLLCGPSTVAAQGSTSANPFQTPSTSNVTPDRDEQLSELRNAAMRLPLAAVLAAILALRPRRRGTPPRSPAVIQTQVVLAVIGALVMAVVGSSLARAFGIVGAAGLVRYRAKVNDPKDAGVMLSTLAIGLASGVGLWVLAIFGTFFLLLVLWLVESFEPMAMRRFALRVKTKDTIPLRPRLETMLRRKNATFEIRTVTPEELHYEMQWPLEQSTDELSQSIIAMGPKDGTQVELEQLKEKS